MVDAPVKRSRASKPKVRTGCLTCKARRIKCDEGKPECKRCKIGGRKCDGFLPAQEEMLAIVPKQLIGVPTVTLPGESRALEFFFHKSAPLLAGFFESAFWNGSVLQLSLVEPAIRQAIAAIGSVHEEQGLKRLQGGSGSSSSTGFVTAVQLYNRAIRLVIARAEVDPNAIPAVTMASILFTCFEFLRGNAPAAASHITSGVRLLQEWRDKTGTQPIGAWGQSHKSFESQFMETELAPILSLFNLNTCEFGPGQRTRIILNAVDKQDFLVLPEKFGNLRESRVALVDLVTSTSVLFSNMDESIGKGQPLDTNLVEVFSGIRNNLDRWKVKFEELVYHKEATWDKKQRSAADNIRIMWYSTEIGILSYTAGTETTWDGRRDSFEEILRLSELLISDTDRYPDDLSRTLSLDLGLIFPLHAIEEAALSVSRMDAPDANEEDFLPPEHARIYDFYCQPLSKGYTSETGKMYTLHVVTFETKPDGPQGEPQYYTESIWMPTTTTQVGDKREQEAVNEIAPLTNLLSTKQWARPKVTDMQTASLLKGVVFGLE
ncbi:Zn(II)2Cys6 transcription factor [Aspergillus ruber CBS 135680]|uniref:Zn(2)-C6 fungal-type domain-containing protein n=1 Tax=Aspergillus ruber (strain CBS 135680) TaxID=1388766 RepID=A0A017S1R7_ASPRC|nr:uncharacterized protein EURHEDRAFT_509629 [Aspergillus ruber CBS 135680]EYE90902.1 hypothetical protein EURHEDRAFT_509629 [Aspergillus ruber CBS 135680]